MNITKNIKVEELVPQETYERLGAEACSCLVNKNLVIAVQLIRDHFDLPVVINNWITGGAYNFRGWRPKNCKVGATNSQHKTGGAIDFTIPGIEPEAIRKYIRENWLKLFKPLGVTRMERNVSWVHIDIKPTGKDVLVEFNP